VSVHALRNNGQSGKANTVGGGGDGYEANMEHRMTALETRIDTILPTLATKADVESIKTDIHKAIGETHKWMIGTIIGLFVGFGGLFLAMSNALKPQSSAPAPAAQQPIVITIPAQLPPQNSIPKKP
jgi:hypothetical protein